MFQITDLFFYNHMRLYFWIDR